MPPWVGLGCGRAEPGAPGEGGGGFGDGFDDEINLGEHDEL